MSALLPEGSFATRELRTARVVIAALFASLILLSASTSSARRLKIYSLPKTISPGQIGVIIFENPEVETARSISKCNPERLIAWVKSDIPILRFEQNGKQVWTSFGSYSSMGDSCVASFLTPSTLEAGAVLVYLVNHTEASVPASLTITPNVETQLLGLVGSSIQPLHSFRLLVKGFVQVTPVAKADILAELEHNIGYSKLSPADQWTVMNRRVTNDWDKEPEGDFLYLEQGDKKWRAFVDECGIEKEALTLAFTAPPDIKPGPLTLTLRIRQNKKEVARSAPLVVTVQ